MRVGVRVIVLVVDVVCLMLVLSAHVVLLVVCVQFSEPVFCEVCSLQIDRLWPKFWWLHLAKTAFVQKIRIWPTVFCDRIGQTAFGQNLCCGVLAMSFFSAEKKVEGTVAHAHSVNNQSVTYASNRSARSGGGPSAPARA